MMNAAQAIVERCSAYQRCAICLRMILSENRFPLFGIMRYLIASGLVGEPTAPVIGIAGATNMNS